MEREFLERVLNISRKMAETRALGPLLNYAMDEAISLVGAERGYLVLLSKDGSLEFRVQRGHDGDELHGSQDQISTSILSDVIKSGQPLTVRDAGNDPKFGHSQSVMLLKIRSVLCVPLIARGETIGAIYVENRAVKGRFKDDDLAPLIFFANQAAVLIENATLNDELETRVTERTQELQSAMDQIEQSWMETVDANRLRTMLLGNVAHDLRAPLAIVVGSLSLMLEGGFGDLNAEQTEWASKALDASNYVLKLTNDVFDLAKLELHRLELFPEEVNPSDLLSEIFDIAKGLPWPPTVKLNLDIRTELPIIRLDPVRIRQVMLNLISNALKFTRNGSVTIHAEYRKDENNLLLGVADTGEGIPQDKLEGVFQRFQQADTDSRRRGTGAGLGLAICRELIEMHQGQIWVESQLGQGSDFKFTLPTTIPVSEASE